MCAVITCHPACDLINFIIDFSFLIKPFSYMTKKSEQKFKYLTNKKSIWGEIKSIFYHLQKSFSCQKLLQTWGCVFKPYLIFTKLFLWQPIYGRLRNLLQHNWLGLKKLSDHLFIVKHHTNFICKIL